MAFGMNIARAAIISIVMVTGPALAQNSDLAILFNVSIAKWEFGTVSETQYRIGAQGSYAWQILERRTGRLYIEVPVSSFAPPIRQGVITSLGDINQIARPESVIFATPGIRYYFNVKPRVAIYAAVGAGIALRQQKVFLMRPRPETSQVSELHSVRTGWKGSPAFDVAGGLDFRLTRLLRIRGEQRAFRTSSAPGYGTGRNYPSAHAGFGFHF